MNGPYGPYVKCGKINASLPEGMTPEKATLKAALAWLDEKSGETSEKAPPKKRKAG